MNNIVSFVNYKDFRQKCCFKNKPVQYLGEDGTFHKYPCIVLYEIETDIPVIYTGLERYLCHLVKSEHLSEKTLSPRAYAVCHFLNYILKKTDINTLHECTVKTIKDFLISMKTKEDGNSYHKDTWVRYKDYVIDFLFSYYKANKEVLTFSYLGEDLKSIATIEDIKHHKKINITNNSSFFVSPPKNIHKKNRILIDGYFDLFLYEAKKYEPDIALGMALGAYAGIREGEVVNTCCGRIIIDRKGFNAIPTVTIDLTKPAPYFMDWEKKTDPGKIKRPRKQKVYQEFVTTFITLYEDHIARMEMKGLDTRDGCPIFVNKQGNPMTVQTYSDRIKTLFYDRFLPNLKIACELQGTYAENAAFIEAYEEEYPGAHMLRHWFTMYLIKKGLTSGEIMKWRGDKSQEAMNDYIHENQDLIEVFKESSYSFQEQILEDIYL